MSFDPSTYRDTPARQAEIFSLEGLRDWLMTQPDDAEYDYAKADDCVLTRYFGDHGFEKTDTWGYGGRIIHTAGESGSPLIKVARTYPQTYGAALARCEALLAKQT